MKLIDTSPTLSAERVKQIKQIIGKSLCFVCAVENMCIVLLSSMVSIIKPTEQEEKILNQFFEYMATHPNAVVRFHASDMILCADTNASYLTEPHARSFAEEYFFSSWRL